MKKPLKHGAKLEGGTSTLAMAPEEIEEDYLDAGDEEGAGEASFEMQRYAAKAAAKKQSRCNECQGQGGQSRCGARPRAPACRNEVSGLQETGSAMDGRRLPKY